MILLTPKFSESFENSRKDNGMLEIDQERDCFGCFADNECTYNEEYIEVFSPTVFETVEIYTSDKSDDASEVFETESSSILTSTERPAINEISLNTIDTTVSTLDNLEPGTYTLDVLESSDFDFDAVFVDSANFESNMDDCENTFGVAGENMAPVGKDNDLDGAKGYKLRNCRTSVRKPLATKYPNRNVTAREFLHSFSNDLRNSEAKAGNEEESKSLSWLLDFKISSIFHPVENEAENSEKSKKKINDAQKKPRYTYTELIEQALKENGELTVSGIYNWISKHYPYYQQNDDRWKNSVRHNLSINPQFRKGKKASQGAGHFWNISDSSLQTSESNSSKSPSPQEKNKTMKSITDIINQIDEEVLAATKSIQENENMDFTDVSLHDAAEQLQIDGKNAEASFVHISRNDIENLWESTHDTSDQRFTSFSPLIRELTEDSSNMEDENFLIQDINNSICLGDELFANGLQSPYYGLTTL